MENILNLITERFSVYLIFASFFLLDNKIQKLQFIIIETIACNVNITVRIPLDGNNKHVFE